MSIPFTVNDFLRVFEVYNLSVFPMQIIAYILGVLMVIVTFTDTRGSSKLVSGGLAFFWLWNGVMYHILNFSSINKLAYLFGALFVIQGLLLFVLGVVKNEISFRFRPTFAGIIGSLFIVYAMLIYPILGYLFGHAYPQSPVFGVAPCPTTIFTFGLFLWSVRLPKKVLWIPLVWSLVGFMAALSLGIKEDIGLLISGMVAVVIVLFRQKWYFEKTEPCGVAK